MTLHDIIENFGLKTILNILNSIKNTGFIACEAFGDHDTVFELMSSLESLGLIGCLSDECVVMYANITTDGYRFIYSMS